MFPASATDFSGIFPCHAGLRSGGGFFCGGVYAPAGGDFEYVFLNILEILYFFL
jgi:hypothetical protein